MNSTETTRKKTTPSAVSSDERLRLIEHLIVTMERKYKHPDYKHIVETILTMIRV